MLKFTIEFKSLVGTTVSLNDKEKKILAGMIKDAFSFYAENCFKESFGEYVRLLNRYDAKGTGIENAKYYLSLLAKDVTLEAVKVKVKR